MRIFKISIVCLLAVLMVFTALPVLAIESTEKIGDCRVYFSIKDNTDGAFIDSITVKMINSALNLDYNFEIEYLDYKIGIPVVGTVKTGKYTISFNYFSSGEYVLKNVDGTPISSQFTAVEGDHTFEWIVESRVPQTSQPPTFPGTTEQPSFMVSEEADALYQKYISVIASLIDENEKVQSWVVDKKNDFEYFVKSFNKKGRLAKLGRTKDEMQALSIFEKCIAQTIVFEPYISAEFYDDWEGLDYWNDTVIVNYLTTHKRFSEEAYNCFKELMEWNYYHYELYGVPYDFLKNAELLHGDPDGNIADEAIERLKEKYPKLKDSDDEQETTSSESSEVYVNSETETVSVSSEIESAIVSEPLDIESPSENEEDGGLWGEPIRIFMKGVVFTLVIVIITAAIIFIVMCRRRTKK